MRASLKNAFLGSLAALAFGLSALGSSGPAAAQNYPHGGYHGGYHGGHGGWHHGGWGPAIGLGIAGLAAGAIIASQPHYGYGGYGDGYDSCTAYRPVYDAWGNYLGRRPVNVC